MSARQTPPNSHEEDDLFDYGDRIAGSWTLPPSNELEATVLRVQRALRVSEPRSPIMQPALKNAIWEDIMDATASGRTLAPTGAWDSPPREHPPRSGVTTGHRTRLPFGRMGTVAANAVLALIIVFVGFAAWKGIGGFGTTGGDGEPTTISGVALQAATPESNETPDVVASPDAALETLTNCDLSGDIPIIPQLAEGEDPISTTALYVVRNDRTNIDPRGTLKFGCAGEESVVLTENVVSVGPGPWPGIVQVGTLPPGDDDIMNQTSAYVDIATGAMIPFAYISEAQQVGVDGSPWAIVTLPDDPTALAIADLRTMETRPFSEVAGVSAPAGSIVILSAPADDGTIAIGIGHPYSGDATDGTLMTDLEAPGDLLLLGSSFDDARWITVPDSLPRISGNPFSLWLSPDGAHAAVVSMGEGDVMAESYKYGLISTSDGAAIAASADIPYMDNPFVAWVQEGGAVAYLAGSSLQTLSIGGAAEPETIFEADSQLFGLQTTWDPNVVVARVRMDHGAEATAGQTAHDIVYSVNVASGDVLEFAGMDASASVSWITEAGALVMFQWLDTPSETVTYAVFDPVTGDQIGEIVDAPSVQVSARTLPTIGPSSIGVSGDGSVEVIALGSQHVYAFTAGTDGLTMKRVESPAGLLSEAFLTANVYLSPDGAMLSLRGEEDEGRTRYLISLNDPDAEWLEIPNTVVGERGSGSISFVDGTRD